MARCGGLGVAVAFGASPDEAWAAPGAVSFTPNVWVTIGADDIVTIMFALAEMGQGIMTGLPVLIAEEMDADWAKVRVIQSPSDPEIYGDEGKLGTFGSASTRTSFEKLRLVGAQARRILLLSAAERLSAPITELTTQPGLVVHDKTGRSLSFGVLAETARVPAPLPKMTKADLKPTAQFRYIGTNLPRVDVPSKVNGSAIYGIDVQLPDMLYGAILRPIVQGEKPLSIDDRVARSIPGITAIIPLANGVGVIGETVEATQKAKLSLRVKWSDVARARSYTSQAVLADYRAVAGDKTSPVAIWGKKGDAAAAIAGAARTLTRQYMVDHVAHFCMEPMNATAQVNGDAIEVWASNQSPTNLKLLISKAAGVTPDKVVVHSTLLGGGFGRRYEADFGVDAYFLAKEVPGRPVKVIWSREDDVQTDPYRPLAAQEIEVGLDAAGDFVGWRHRIVGDSYMARTAPPTLEKLGGFDMLVAFTFEPPYQPPAYVTEYVRQDRGIAVGAWRGISLGYTVFAVESMIDELAFEAKADPLAFRLTRLKKDPRATKALETVARMARWGEERPNRALGIAYTNTPTSYLATVAEISLDERDGAIRVHAIWCAADFGILVQPLNVAAQLEGGLVFGMGAALYEQLNITKGEIEESNFGEYRVTRMSDMPEIHIELIATDNPPAGVGEASVPSIAPAIANAFARLTGGKRLRQLPMLPARCKRALTQEARL